MLEPKNNNELPAIPGKRYFTIGEVSDLCGVKPHVLRYWEQEFPQLKPVKRRGNRRYYQRQDVIIIRQIRSLLYEQGFTIGGARNKLGGDEARTDISQRQQIVPARPWHRLPIVRPRQRRRAIREAPRAHQHRRRREIDDAPLPDRDMKRLLHRAEQTVAIEETPAHNQLLAPFEPGGDFGKGLDNSGVDGVRS